MIKLIVLILFFGSMAQAKCINEIAQSELAKSKAGVPNAGILSCKDLPNEPCFCFDGKDLRHYDIVDVNVDDYSKPTYSTKYNVVACTDASDCSSKIQPYQTQNADPILANKYCDQAYSDYVMWGANTPPLPGYSIWCWRNTGFEQKIVKELQLNAATKATVEAADAAKATEDAGISAVMQKMSQGKRVMAIVSLRNVAKGLTKGQKKQMIQSYGLVKDMLEAGSLEVARDEVTAIVPDATIVTQDDKDAILAEIDRLLGL